MKFQTFYRRLKEYLEIQLFFRVYQIVLKSPLGKHKTPEEWLKVLGLLHFNGYLYYWQPEGKLEAIVGAYRVKEVDEEKVNVIPDKSEGDILYVTLAVSIGEDKLALKRMLDAYIKKNPDVKEIVLYERGDDNKFKSFKVGGKNGKE